jgi:MYXO-CTERM domain-containing protein
MGDAGLGDASTVNGTDAGGTGVDGSLVADGSSTGDAEEFFVRDPGGCACSMNDRGHAGGALAAMLAVGAGLYRRRRRLPTCIDSFEKGRVL